MFSSVALIEMIWGQAQKDKQEKKNKQTNNNNKSIT